MVGRGLLHQLHPRHIRWWQWLALVLLGIVLVIRSWLPEFLRQQIVTQLASLTSAHVRLGDVDMHLLRGYVALQKLTFTLDDDTQPVLAIDNLVTNINLRALLRREIDIKDIHVSGVQLQAVREASGQFNLSRIFSPSSAEPQQPPADLPTLTIQQIRLTDSRLLPRSHSHPRSALPFSNR